MLEFAHEAMLISTVTEIIYLEFINKVPLPDDAKGLYTLSKVHYTWHLNILELLETIDHTLRLKHKCS